MDEVKITVDGATHTVSEGLTVVQAMWHIGREMTKDVGCLGGACGACAISVRFPGRFDNQCYLACQTPVVHGMTIAFMPSDASRKEIAPLPGTQPTGQELFQYYPETRRCVGCRSCTMVCPQGIDTMSAVREAIVGLRKEVADRFTNCVMCGLCAVVCGAGIRPHRVGAYTRRLAGAFHEKRADHLLERINEIASGRYQDEWNEVLPTGQGKRGKFE